MIGFYDITILTITVAKISNPIENIDRYEYFEFYNFNIFYEIIIKNG